MDTESYEMGGKGLVAGRKGSAQIAGKSNVGRFGTIFCRTILIRTIKSTDVFLEQPQISACGKYAYSVDSNVAFDKIKWPKLHHFPRPSDTPTPSQRRRKHPSILKPRHCYVCGTQMFRVRGDEHTGLLFFDRKFASGADSDYCSRVLCVVPDALQDQTVTDVTVVWPSSKDSHVTILLLPRGESTMPVLITSDITSRSLLDDVHFGTTDGSGNDGNNT